MGQLEAFTAVARLGNVSRAAASLNLTQPALTARLQGLESELEAKLFVRGPRGMSLTDAGATLLPYAQRALGQVSDARNALRDLRSGKVGELFIGAAPALSTYVLPALLKTFGDAHPDVRLGVSTGHTEEVLEMVLRRQVHLGVGRPIRHAEAVLITILDDDVELVVGRSKQFARMGIVAHEGMSSG